MKHKKCIFSVVAILACLAIGFFIGKKVDSNSGNSKTGFESPVVEAIMARRSIRNYTDQPVPREILEEIAKIGVNAPSSANRQEWQVRIVDGEYVEGITEVYKEVMSRDPKNAKQVNSDSFKTFFRNAPAAYCIGIPANPHGRYTDLDAGLLSGNICNAALAYGLGTCCLGIQTDFLNKTPEAAEYLKRLNLSEDYKLVLCIAIGYPAESPDAKPRDYSKIQIIE